MQLRPYQNKLKQDIYNAWEIGHRNVLAVLPTGSGKTMIFSNIASEHPGYSCIIAHRQELLFQISLALARWGIKHSVIAPKQLIKTIVSLHMEHLNHSFYDANAYCTVASVDTLLRRIEKFSNWAKNITLWVQDEAHHILKKNKWGKVLSVFPNARGLGVTATPIRADGCGLGRNNDGLMDTVVNGPGMRDLIIQKYLSEYRVFAPPTRNFHLEEVRITANGEYSAVQVKKVIEESTIMGDLVSHYKRIANGKLGITFATDVSMANSIAAAYNQAGIPAVTVCAKTASSVRQELIRRFQRHELLQLVNVCLFDEGFDLPAVEVVSMAQPTASFGRYCQQFGRALRLLIGKPRAFIIDHVGNVLRHGLPDAPQIWSLARRTKRNMQKPEVPIRVCGQCAGVFTGFKKTCPYCGFHNISENITTVKQVTGDLTELSPDTLATMRQEIIKIDASVKSLKQRMRIAGASEIVINSAAKRHCERQYAQSGLRQAIAYWAGRYPAMTESEQYQRFYHTFDIDVCSAQALGRPAATELTTKIYGNILNA